MHDKEGNSKWIRIPKDTIITFKKWMTGGQNEIAVYGAKFDIYVEFASTILLLQTDDEFPRGSQKSVVSGANELYLKSPSI